jgi:TonB family protein
MTFYKLLAELVAVASISLLLTPIAKADEYVMTKDSGRCEPRILRTPTRFPENARSNGASGEVQIQVLLGERVLESRLARSSGYALLDRAAIDSVREDWEFDVSHCNASSLPISTVVTVNYIRAPVTISFGIQRRNTATTTMATSKDRCTVTPGKKEQLVACIQ